MLKNKLSTLVIGLIILSMVVCKYRSFKERDEVNPYPIAWDVYGYYLYLPATFIYNDLGLEDREWIEQTRDKYKPSSTFYQVTNGKENRQVIVYNIGYSFIYAPGFFIAHQLASMLDYEADGFSKPYQCSLEITAFLLTLLGLFLFRKIALHFFSDKITALLLVIILVGTNYYFQVTYDGTMPHNILFTINCLIIWFTVQWHETKKTKYIVFLALFLGLATLCRPTELLWIFIPLCWGVYDKSTFFEKCQLIKKHFFQIALFSILLLSVIFIQFLYYKYATGYFKVLNLHSERFSFFDPYTYKFLFSYKKGWLLYTPIMIFGIVGFYFLFKANKNIWLGLFLFFIVNLYVTSSWECWWYAASFSQRPMVETYAMMLFPIGYFLNWLSESKKKWQSMLLFSCLFLLVLLNIFQTWQFLNSIIDAERMTKEYYWAVFGKTSLQKNERQYLSVDRNQTIFPDYEDYNGTYFKKEVFHLNFENSTETKNIIDTTAAEGKKSFVLKDDIPYTKAFEIPYNELTSKSYAWIRATTWVYLTAPLSESNSCIVISVENGEQSIKYLTSNYKNIQPYKWTEVHLDFITPIVRHDDDVVKAYFWNMGPKPVLIDDFKVEVFEPQKDYQ
jgi:hypothetical protein